MDAVDECYHQGDVDGAGDVGTMLEVQRGKFGDELFDRAARWKEFGLHGHGGWCW